MPFSLNKPYLAPTIGYVGFNGLSELVVLSSFIKVVFPVATSFLNSTEAVFPAFTTTSLVLFLSRTYGAGTKISVALTLAL